MHSMYMYIDESSGTEIHVHHSPTEKTIKHLAPHFNHEPSDEEAGDVLVVLVDGFVQQCLLATLGTGAPHVRITAMTHL